LIMSRRSLPPVPFPVAELLLNPDYIAMPSAGVGMLHRLLVHFWQTECRPLPTSTNELLQISRGHMPTWRSHSLSIHRILAIVLPEMERLKRDRDSRATNMIKAQYASIAARRRNRLVGSQTPLDHSQSPSVYAMNVSPKREPPRFPPTVRPPERRGRFVDR